MVISYNFIESSVVYYPMMGSGKLGIKEIKAIGSYLITAEAKLGSLDTLL